VLRIRITLMRSPDSDASFHFGTDPDPTFHFDAEPDPISHFDADADPDSEPASASGISLLIWIRISNTAKNCHIPTGKKSLYI
jgi:hypothetical protein